MAEVWLMWQQKVKQIFNLDQKLCEEPLKSQHMVDSYSARNQYFDVLCT